MVSMAHFLAFCQPCLCDPSALLQKKPFAILEQFKELDDSVVQKPGTAVQQSGTDIRAEDTSDQMQTEEGAHEAKQPHGNGNVRYEVGFTAIYCPNVMADGGLWTQLWLCCTVGLGVLLTWYGV
jgi:hypothetical protein